MNPSAIGTRGEAAVIMALARLGKEVLVPFGQLRYDVAYVEHGQLVKVQCKSGRVIGGAIQFKTASVMRDGSRRAYYDEADVFGVYCHARDEVYMVPVADCPTRGASLRLRPPRNNQRAGIRMAADYLVATNVTPALRWAHPQLPLD